jgi:hypothetical protein
MTIFCPKNDCNFDTNAMPAMNSHLRRHTSTFKCGHCGKTFPNNSEFHQHSAMTHGNKIPDLVKDPEAEAAFEALRGLVEANLQLAFSKQQAEKRKAANGPLDNSSAAKKPRPSVENKSDKDKNGEIKNDVVENVEKGQTARKSTGAFYFPPSGRKCVARKSTTTLTISSPPFSFYRLPVEPIDYSSISTRMSISGMQISLNASKMSEIIDLKPVVKVQEMQSEIVQKYLNLLEK